MIDKSKLLQKHKLTPNLALFAKPLTSALSVIPNCATVNFSPTNQDLLATEDTATTLTVAGKLRLMRVTMLVLNFMMISILSGTHGVVLTASTLDA